MIRALLRFVACLFALCAVGVVVSGFAFSDPTGLVQPVATAVAVPLLIVLSLRFGRRTQSVESVGRFAVWWFGLSIPLGICRSGLLRLFDDSLVSDALFSIPVVVLSALALPAVAYYLARLGGYERLRPRLPAAFP